MRVNDRNRYAPPVVVCGHLHQSLVIQQLTQIACHDATLIVEPQMKNTAAAVALAAQVVERRSAFSRMVVLPSDHYIGRNAVWDEALEATLPALKQGYIGLLAEEPQDASPEYGYIQLGACWNRHPMVRHVAAFKEKPDRKTAESYLLEGGYGWNCGVFMMDTRTVRRAFEASARDIWDAMSHSIAQVDCQQAIVTPDSLLWQSVRKEAFDRAILESWQKVVAVPAAMQWSDLGSWKSLASYARQYEADMIEFARSGAGSESRDTDTIRPWGKFERIDVGTKYKVKKLYIDVGGKISLQQHQHRSEHWVVVQGVALVTCNERQFTLRHNESTYIPAGSVHRLENVGTQELIVIETQAGDRIDEADITRYEDAYERVLTH